MACLPGSFELASVTIVHFEIRLAKNGDAGIYVTRQNRQRWFINDEAATFEQIESLHHQCPGRVVPQVYARVIAEVEAPSFPGAAPKCQRDEFSLVPTVSHLELFLTVSERDKLSDRDSIGSGQCPGRVSRNRRAQDSREN